MTSGRLSGDLGEVYLVRSTVQRRKTSRRSQADLGEVGEKPPFGYLLAPPLLTDTTAVTGDSQWLLRLFTRDVHTWGTRVYPQLAQYPLSETPDPQKSTNVPSTYPVRNSQLAAISG